MDGMDFASSPTFDHEPLQVGQVHRLDQVAVAPGLARPLPVALLAPAGQGDDRHRPCPTACSRMRRVASSPFSRGIPTSIRITSGRNCSASSTASTPSWAVRTSLPSSRSISARLSAPSRLSSTTRMPPRRRARRRARVARPPTSARSVRGDRQRDGERAALALRPSLAAVTVPPCISTSPLTSASPMPSPPVRPLDAAVHLGEHVEDVRAATRRGCRCRCPARTRRPARRAARRTARSARPARCTWRCWSAGCRTPAPAGSGRRRGRPAAPGSETVSSCPAASMSGRAVSTALSTTSASATRVAAQLHLVAADAGDVEQVVDQPHHVRELPVHHLAGLRPRRPRRPPAGGSPAGRCGSGPAGCAARGPAAR